MTDPQNYENFEYVRRGEALGEQLVMVPWNRDCCAHWLASNRQLQRRLIPRHYSSGRHVSTGGPFSFQFD